MKGGLNSQIPLGSKVYISGPISGRCSERAKKSFEIASNFLSSLGAKPVNPMLIPAPDILSLDKPALWVYYMKESIKLLVGVDAVYMLSGWSVSKGAGLERMLASRLDIPVLYEEA